MNQFVLPIQATGRVDVGRLLREVEQIDSFLRQSAIREPGTSVKMPKTSRLLDEFTGSNKLNLLHEDDRAQAINFLSAVKTKAPLLHMSFSVDPSPAFTQKLTSWLRQEIHPFVLLQVGLQPNIGAGCVVRTTNKHFDFSLREHFKKQRPLLIQKLHGDMQQPAPPTGPQQPAEQAEPSQSSVEYALTPPPVPVTQPDMPDSPATQESANG